jgi:hypothetical protein
MHVRRNEAGADHFAREADHPLDVGLDAFFSLISARAAQIPALLRLPIRLNHGPSVQGSMQSS